MPNVLVEVGFLSNKHEATKLGKSSYRREVARAIFEAILDTSPQDNPAIMVSSLIFTLFTSFALALS